MTKSVRYNQISNFYSLVRYNIKMFGDAVKALNSYRKNSVHGKLRVSLSAFGYANDGSTIIADECNETLWVDVIVSREGITWLRVASDFFSQEDYVMTGNHSSCYFDGWENNVINTVLDAADGMLSDGYWEIENHSTQPIHLYFHIQKLHVIDDPKHEADKQSDHTIQGYVRKLTNAEDYQ